MIGTVAELYCGAGLFGEGFARRGFKAIFAADLDSSAVASYNMNLSPVARVWDVRNVVQDLSCDVLLAGPPCQGFSTLGCRDQHDERNRLSLPVADWAFSTGAKVVVVENVPQFIESVYWKRLAERFERRGYEVAVWILDALDYGVPQRRTRSFTVFSKIGIPPQPVPSAERLTVRDAFRGLPETPLQKGLDVAPSPSPLAMRRFLAAPRNGDKRDILRTAPELCPKSWFEMGAQATDVWGRMDFDGPSNTVRCCFQNPSKGRYVHPTENRVITLREGARLQGVPDKWNFVGHRTAIARQIGNGVPVPLAEAVAESVARLFRSAEETAAPAPPLLSPGPLLWIDGPSSRGLVVQECL